ncbi:MAG TPA: S-methyl-5-thioribose-1-phosphate isomerase, partial [Elusimicrobia bacterium]|nr:S-methyl-5-thioribose-1-phosphate isomerase [Elusimicrobiota bacterium]
DLLKAARPTAVALFYAADRMLARALEFADAHPRPFCPAEKGRLVSLLEKEARLITAEDERACLDIGRHGARLLPENCVIMTHCNAGALATMGIGTAVGVITEGRKAGKVKRAYACETRPYLQGARLTIWELMREKVPSELITDNMAAHIIKTCGVNAIVVGADRIAANGDTANKVGTYGLAIIARHHGIPFYVAAPVPTIDMATGTGDDIEIEERSCDEVVLVKGRRIAPKKVRARHPAFDVTPAGLITALITERGAISPVSARNIRARLA